MHFVFRTTIRSKNFHHPEARSRGSQCRHTSTDVTTDVTAVPKKAREKKLKASITNQKQNKEKINNNIGDFNDIANEYASLDGWSRNPFVDVYEPKPIASIKIPEKNIQMVQKEIAKEETFELNALDRLNIETAVRMGEKAFVTINGKTFREGDLINDALIEKIENEQITFKVGTTRIIKNVGI